MLLSFKQVDPENELAVARTLENAVTEKLLIPRHVAHPPIILHLHLEYINWSVLFFSKENGKYA